MNTKYRQMQELVVALTPNGVCTVCITTDIIMIGVYIL
jgi:hypothetical protein